MWKERASGIGRVIVKYAESHPELEPLVTSWRNFARKHGISFDGSFQEACEGEYLVIRREEYLLMLALIGRQTDEIEALEFRIKTLLER